MPNTLLWIILTIVFTFLYIFLDGWFLKLMKIKPKKVKYESAKTSLDRLSTWTTWLTGLQTAALAAIGLLLHQFTPITQDMKRYTFFSLLFFGASIIIATWLLSALPSIQQQLILTEENEDGVEENDVYMANLYSFVPLRFGRFTGLVHTFFLTGIVFFALFIFALLSHSNMQAH